MSTPSTSFDGRILGRTGLKVGRLVFLSISNAIFDFNSEAIDATLWA